MNNRSELQTKKKPIYLILGKLFFHSVSRLNLVALNASACCSTVSLTIFQKHSDTAKLRFLVVICDELTTPPLKKKKNVLDIKIYFMNNVGKIYSSDIFWIRSRGYKKPTKRGPTLSNGILNNISWPLFAFRKKIFRDV